MKNTTNKILTIAVVLLLLVNIALVVFMIKGRKTGDKRHGKGDPFEMMVKELNMTEQQQKEYKQQKEEHLKNIKPLFDSVRAAKTAFYSLIKDVATSDSTISVYGQRITERQAAIDKLTFAHFKRVRNLFTPDQQPRFDDFILKMMQRGRKDSAAKKNKED